MIIKLFRRMLVPSGKLFYRVWCELYIIDPSLRTSCRSDVVYNMEKSNVYCYDMVISRACVCQARGLYLTLTLFSLCSLLYYLKIMRPTGARVRPRNSVLSEESRLVLFPSRYKYLGAQRTISSERGSPSARPFPSMNLSCRDIST